MAPAQAVVRQALAWWDFEGDMADTIAPSRPLSPVASHAAAFEPEVAVAYEAAGHPAFAGKRAVVLEGREVLKSNNPAFRIGGSQTFWLRINFGSVPGNALVGLMGRTRANNNHRGIALQMSNGRLQGVLSGDGAVYDVVLQRPDSLLLEPGKWYDISLRFDSGRSLRIDVRDPAGGALLDSMVQTANIPPSVPTGNNIGSGYFQISGVNSGSGGSRWLLPRGTMIEAAGVWSFALSDDQIGELSGASGAAATQGR